MKIRSHSLENVPAEVKEIKKEQKNNNNIEKGGKKKKSSTKRKKEKKQIKNWKTEERVEQIENTKMQKNIVLQ